MGDNSIKEAVSCPMRDFSSAQFSSASLNMYSSENQNNSTGNDEKESSNNHFGAKDSSTFAIPNLSLMLPKRFDENQDSQDELPNPDLHNGHNNPDAIDIAHRNKSIGELFQESEELPDSVLMDCTKEYSSVKETEQKSDSSNSEKDNTGGDGIEENAERSQNSQENSEEDKTQEDSVSQDFFDDKGLKEDRKFPSPDPDSSQKNDSLNSNDNQDSQFTEGFDLHLSETQSFLPPAEKSSENPTTVSESEDSNTMEEESNDKLPEESNEKLSEDNDMSNESSGNGASNSDLPAPKETLTSDGNENDKTPVKEFDREDVSKESSDTGKDISEEDKPETESVDKDNERKESLDECDKSKANVHVDEGSKSSPESKVTEEGNNPISKEEPQKSSNDETDNKMEETAEPPQSEGKPESGEEPMEVSESNEDEDQRDNKGNKNEKEEMEKDEAAGESKQNEEEESKESTKEEAMAEKASEEKLNESNAEETKPQATRVSSRTQRKKQSKKEASQKEEETEIIDKKLEPMEIEGHSSEPASDNSLTCTCQPPCHGRIETVSQHLNSACTQLDDFIKLKRRDENKVLKNFLDMLKEIHSISQNKKITGETKISEHALIPEDTKPKRTSGVKRKSSDLDTPLKENPRKRVNTEEKSTKKTEKKSNVEFKDLKGLAVFAKWPNSGWYYPGKVEELTGSDWKEANNVTVKFYDGLVREMKNINIIPAYLIPPGSMLCDLEDETEMLVISCDGSNQNSVDFKLSTKENPGREIDLNFNKLAIRANHMKTIKQQLEPTTDVVPKKMHMVSLDNLVSGRRSRGRSKKDAEAAEEKTPPANQTERRSSGSSSTPSKKAATPKRARN